MIIFILFWNIGRDVGLHIGRGVRKLHMIRNTCIWTEKKEPSKLFDYLAWPNVVFGNQDVGKMFYG